MTDAITQKLFENPRWEKVLESAVAEKHMSKSDMRRLCDPAVRANLYLKIQADSYEIAPPHIQLIPKDTPGEFREVYINENMDRIFLSIMNDMMFEFCPEFIHPHCKSYQTGIGCGKVVQEAVKTIGRTERKTIGFKSDLSKYFDRCCIEQIDKVFTRIEQKCGESKALNVVKKYYHTDWCFDSEGNLIQRYQSLKQGCAFASFLADTLLYQIDKEMTERAKKSNGFYCRYSDDMLYIAPDYESALEDLRQSLTGYGLTLNPKKVEILDKDHWFKFLGFEIKGSQVSLSQSRTKSFQKEIEKRTIKKNITIGNAVKSVSRYLYGGKYCWATSVLPIINSAEDIQILNEFIMDAIRACKTDKKKIGGLGCQKENQEHFITRGTGKNVSSNRQKISKEIDGYLSLMTARNALLSSHEAYDCLVRSCLM